LNGTAGADTFNIVANAGAVEASGVGPLVRVVNGEQALDFIGIVGVGSDIVNVNGTALADTMAVTANGTYAHAIATGFTIPVQVNGALRLVMNGLDGPDTITCTGNLAAIVPLTLNGGNDNDTLLGSNGADIILGGDGNDFIDGQQGDDIAFLGADNDTFNWDPGDGNDTIEGQTGTDTLVFNGSNIGEIIDVSPNGGRVRFFRNVANITMDLDDVERIDFRALGGADQVVVNSLAGTDITQVTIDLGAFGGGGDAQLDVVTVNGSASPDAINITANAGAVDVSGLAALVRITNSEAANDDLVVNGLGGTDTITTGGGVAALIEVIFNQ
jgi:Ca2+-binding RTX toxin-like protein